MAQDRRTPELALEILSKLSEEKIEQLKDKILGSCTVRGSCLIAASKRIDEYVESSVTDADAGVLDQGVGSHKIIYYKRHNDLPKDSKSVISHLCHVNVYGVYFSPVCLFVCRG